MSISRDSKFAIRRLWHDPIFSITVIVTLAAAIGVNTAIFSVINALFLARFPYADADRMAVIYTRITGAQPFDEHMNIDGTQWNLLRDDVPSLLSAISSGIASGVNLQSGSTVTYLHEGRVSAHYLDVFEIRPFAGRNFSESDDRPHGPQLVLLSFRVWHDLFGADPNAVGKSLTLKGDPYTIIGILPQGAATPLNADVYTPLQASPEGEGSGTNFEAVARLREGRTWADANAELNRSWSKPSKQFSSSNPGLKMDYHLVPIRRGQTENLRPESIALMAAAGLILLIACSNLAGLTLARNLTRAGELTARLAFGATKWQVQRQLWVENLLLALLGGAVGVVVGYISLHGLLRLLPLAFLPVTHVDLDPTVLGFTLLLSLLTCILFGMAPAFSVRKLQLTPWATSRAVAGDHRLRFRQVLISGEIAIAVGLLTAMGLLMRTLIHLETLQSGYSGSGVITAKASLDDRHYRTPEAFQLLVNRSLAAMRNIPGVEHVAVGLTLPYERPLNESMTLYAGNAPREIQTDFVYVTPEYFQALHIPVILGRAFTDQDGMDKQPVAIVNRTLVRKFFPTGNPIGAYLDKNVRIVGIVGDTAISSGLDADAPPLTYEQTVYVPAAQVSSHLLGVHIWYQPSWIVQMRSPNNKVTAEMQHTFQGVAPNLPFSGFYSMPELMGLTLVTQRLEVTLLAVMAILALSLSAIGIFALVANLVVRRNREIGIRMALGATVPAAMREITTPVLTASAAGLCIGLLICLFVLRTMHSALYGVASYDPVVMTGAVCVIACVTVLASALPALRIARIDPARALRDQ